MPRGTRGYAGGRGIGSGGASRGGSYRGSSRYYNRNDRDSGFEHHSSSYSSHSKNNYDSSHGGSHNNYESRSRDKFSNASRHPTDHKRSYRSSRDRSQDRKRSRHEDTRFNSNYSSSSNAPSYRRNESSSRTNNRQTPPVRSSSSYRTSRDHRDDRRSINDTMGPPKSIPTTRRIIRTSRTGLSSSNRIRGSGTRTIRGIIRKRGDPSTDMKIMRKKLILANQRDRARRIKIAKLTSSLRRKRETSRRSEDRKESSTRSASKKRSEKKSDDDDKVWVGEELTKNSERKKLSSTKKKTENGDGNLTAGDDENNTENNAKKGAETDGSATEISIKKGRIVVEINEAASTKDDEDSDKKDDKKEANDKDSTKRKEHRESKSKSPRKSRRTSYIKLTCFHCHTKSFTFQEYGKHLFHRTHRIAMRRLALRQKAQLSQMRLKQRNAQRELEENSKEELEDCKPQFCLLCRLNYRQPKAKHQLSEHHRNMKKFLMPYCNTCHLAFKSPMMYESHRCSLEHIKRKARNNESHSRDQSEDEKEVDLANFMTVDSIGEIDGIDGEHQTDEENKEKVNIGADHVKKTEAFYCDLCRMYFSIKEDEEGILKKHCLTRSHLKSYLRFKKDQDLQAEAERVQRKDAKDHKKKDDKESEETDNKNEDIDIKQETTDENEGDETEDKLWDDVDKDLGDLLREVAPEDDEEDGSVLDIGIGERYDKFKTGDKPKPDELNGNSKTDEKDKTLSKELNDAVVDKGESPQNQ